MRSLRRSIALLSLIALVASLPVAATAQAPFFNTGGKTLQSAATATGNGSTLDTSQAAVVTFQASGITSATITFEGSNDNSNWNSLSCWTLDSGTQGATVTANGYVRCNVNGIPLVRARISTYVSGTITVVANATSAVGNIRDFNNVTAYSGMRLPPQTTAPTCSGCGSGTTPAVGVVSGSSDSLIRLLIGSNGASPYTVTFGAAFASAPVCLATFDATNSANGYYVYNIYTTTTTVRISTSGTAAFDRINIWCPGLS